MHRVQCGSIQRMRHGVLHHLRWQQAQHSGGMRFVHSDESSSRNLPVEVLNILAGARAAVEQINVQPTSEKRAALWSEQGRVVNQERLEKLTREAIVAQLGDAFGNLWTSLLLGKKPRTDDVQAISTKPGTPHLLLNLDSRHTSLLPIIGQALVFLSQADVRSAVVALRYLRFFLVPLHQLCRDLPMLSAEQAGHVHTCISYISTVLTDNMLKKHGIFSAVSAYDLGIRGSAETTFDGNRSLVLSRYVGMLGACGQYEQARAFVQACAEDGYTPEAQVLTALIYAAVDTGHFGDAVLLYLSSFDLGLPPGHISSLRGVMVEVVYQAARQGKVHALLAVMHAKPADLVDRMSTQEISAYLRETAADADSPTARKAVASSEMSAGASPGQAEEGADGEEIEAETGSGLGPSAIRRLARSLLRGTRLDSSSELGSGGGVGVGGAPASSSAVQVDQRDGLAAAGVLVEDMHAAITATCTLAEADTRGDTFSWLTTTLVRLHALSELCGEDARSLSRAISGGVRGMKAEYDARISTMAQHITGRQQAVPDAASNRALRADGKVFVDRTGSGEGAALTAEAASAAYQRMSAAVNAGVAAMVDSCMIPAADAHGLQHAGPGSSVRARAALGDRVKRLFGVLEMLGVQPDVGTLAACLRAAAHVRSHELIGWILGSFGHLLTSAGSPAGSPDLMQSLLQEFRQPLLVPTLLRALPAMMAAGLRPSHEQVGLLLAASAQTWATAQTVSCPHCGQGRESAATQAHGGQDVEEEGEGALRKGRPGKEGSSVRAGQESLSSLASPPVHPLSHTRLGPVAKSSVRMFSSTGLAFAHAHAEAASVGMQSDATRGSAASTHDSSAAADEAPVGIALVHGSPLSAASEGSSKEVEEAASDSMPVVRGRQRRGTAGAAWTPKSPLTAAQGLLQALGSNSGQRQSASMGRSLPTGTASVDLHTSKTVQCVGAKKANPRLDEEWPMYPSKCLGILSSLGLLSTPTHASMPKPIADSLVLMAKLAGQAGCSREAWAVWSTLRSLGVPAVYDSAHPIVRSLLHTFLAGGLQVPAWEAYLLLYPKRAPGPLPSLHAMKDKLAQEGDIGMGRFTAVPAQRKDLASDRQSNSLTIEQPVAVANIAAGPVASATAAALAAGLAQAEVVPVSKKAAKPATNAQRDVTPVPFVTTAGPSSPAMPVHTEERQAAQVKEQAHAKGDDAQAQLALIQQLLRAFEQEKAKAMQLEAQLSTLQEQVKSLSVLVGNTPAEAEKQAASVPPSLQTVVTDAKRREQEQLVEATSTAAANDAVVQKADVAAVRSSGNDVVARTAKALLQQANALTAKRVKASSYDARWQVPVTYSPSGYIYPNLVGGVTTLLPVAFVAVPRWLHDALLRGDDRADQLSAATYGQRTPLGNWAFALKKTLTLSIRAQRLIGDGDLYKDLWHVLLRHNDAFLQPVPPALRPVPDMPHMVYMGLHPSFAAARLKGRANESLPEPPGQDGMQDAAAYLLRLQAHPITQALQRIVSDLGFLKLLHLAVPDVGTVSVPLAASTAISEKAINMPGGETSGFYSNVRKFLSRTKELVAESEDVTLSQGRGSKRSKDADSAIPTEGYIQIKVVPVPTMSDSVRAEYALLRAETMVRWTFRTVREVQDTQKVLMAERAGQVRIEDLK